MGTNSPSTRSTEELEKEISALLDAIKDVKNIHIGCSQDRYKMKNVIERMIGDLRDQEETYCPNCKTHTQYEYDLRKINDEFSRVLYENEMIISINALNEIVQKHSEF